MISFYLAFFRQDIGVAAAAQQLTGALLKSSPPCRDLLFRFGPQGGTVGLCLGTLVLCRLGQDVTFPLGLCLQLFRLGPGLCKDLVRLGFCLRLQGVPVDRRTEAR